MSKDNASIPIGETLTIRDLIRKRGNIKTRLTNYTKYVDQFEGHKLLSDKRIQFQLRLEAAESIYSDFVQVQTALEDSVSDSDIEEYMSERESFESSYFSIVAIAKGMLEEEQLANPTFKKSDGNPHQSIKLPTITIPTFDGSYERWLEFRDTYLSLVHNCTEISHIQKFHYLKSSLTGSAALVIDSLEFSAANYIVAWELITNRYNNTRLLVHNHVKALFSIQPLTKESPLLLRKLIDCILKNIRALKMLGEPTDSWDTLIIYIVVSKLDNITEREWEQHKSSLLRGDSKSSLKLSDLLGFLKDRADMLETLIVTHSKGNDNRKQSAAVVPKVHCHISTTKPSTKQRSVKKLCLMCNANHPLYSCQKFLDLSYNEKLQFVADKKLCENCMRTGHVLVDCRFGPCRKCNVKHNTLLHRDESAENAVINRAVTLLSVGVDKQSESTGSVTSPTQFAHMQNAPIHSHVAHEDINNALQSSLQPVLLSTALVEIFDKSNNKHTVRVLLDSGSQRCFISKSLCELIKAPLVQSTQQITGVGNSVTQCTQTCNITLMSTTGNYKTHVQCLVLPEITSTIPSVGIKLTEFRIPDHIQLADPKFHEAQSIELLIGADLFWDLLDEGRMRLSNGPYLQNTRLGWIISGPILSKTTQTNRSQCFFLHSVDLDSQLRRFWELEELWPTTDALTDEERACENHFIQSTKREADGRFCVRIPFKESPEKLGETRDKAERRFVALEKRLDRSPEYKKMYRDFIMEYISLGHMIRVDIYSAPHFFMPHHGVFREHSTTTKLRVVFDASAKSTTGKSLNDLQMVGPAIQGDLMSILLRFRQYAYVACADVQKMYRQCMVDKNQRDLQLILWRDHPSDPFDVYQLNTVTYGTASAPFLAVRCLKQLAFECSDPDVARTINEDFYVDDLCTGADSLEKITFICRETEKQLSLGCLPLRKWVFNYDCELQTDTTCASRELSLGEQAQSKTLGLGWYNLTDELHFHTELKPHLGPLTKRVILSQLSQIFDPLGLLSPTIIIAKILLQKLWLLKLTWDEPVPCDVTRSWQLFLSNLSELHSLRVPRHVKANAPLSIELHLFTDASQNAYGACAYVRTFCKDGTLCVRLLCSKGKVAPLKPVSIPRLELCGALLGAKLYAKISKSLYVQFDKVIFWTDSTIVLGWLRMAPRLLKTFVQTRTSSIQELTREHSWQHVRGKDNPADLVSRGLHLDELKSSQFWWEGPEFLHDPSFDSTRLNTAPEIDPQNLPEVNNKWLGFSCQDVTDTCILIPFSRYSQFSRLARACAYVLRFICNARNKRDRRTGNLSATELEQSRYTLARFSQMESFSIEYQCLLEHKPINKSRQLSGLNLFLDESGVMRVGGRLQNSDDFSFDKKHPILISANHRLALLLFRSQHVSLLHAGPQLLLYTIREVWWPIGGRNLAKRVVHDCVKCARLKAKTLKPIMGNLPKERLMPGFPFMRCGVDYAGPVSVLNRKGRGAKTEKSYICLFVCFATRAIHLELVGDLSSDAYLLALKRFISRRGKPVEIFSDNGKNFVGLKNNFSQFLNSCSREILEYALSQDIKFSFIPPYSPHFGGLWEAGVKSCKHHLRRVVGNANLTYEELGTVLTQIEAILNSRPLTPMSSEPNDFLPLSPAHFLVGRPLTAPACADLDTVPMNRLSRYERLEQMRQHFWIRWSKEYVSELQTRSKWKEDNAGLAKDTLVIIKDDNLPPLKWLLGRIINTVPGKDGVSRVADIQTATGVIRRAFSKICPLLKHDDQQT